jgi:hypothetical protein
MPLLNEQVPAMHRLPPGLSAAQHKQLAQKLQAKGVEGLEASCVGDDATQWPDTACDLDFLKHYKDLKYLNISLPGVTSFDPINQFASSLEWLQLGEPNSRKLSLSCLNGCQRLRELRVTGQIKDVETIGQLTQLGSLSLGSMTLPDLSLIASLIKLERFHLQFGGTTDLSGLEKLERLKAITLLRVKGLADLTAISSIKGLQYLCLDGLKQVTALPGCSRLKRLRRVQLETMNGLEDLSGLAPAESLEDLIVIECNKLLPSAFACLQDHPSLKQVLAGIGLINSRKVKEVDAMFAGRVMDGFYGTSHEQFSLQ